MNETPRQCIVAAAVAILCAPGFARDTAATRPGQDVAKSEPAASRPASKPQRQVPASDRPLPAPSPPRTIPRGSSEWTGWIRTLVALAVVIALIFVARLILRRFGGGARGGPRGKVLEVLARTSTSARHQLLVVRMGERIVLIGQGPSGMTALSEITEADEISRLLSAAGKGDPQPQREQDE